MSSITGGNSIISPSSTSISSSSISSSSIGSSSSSSSSSSITSNSSSSNSNTLSIDSSARDNAVVVISLVFSMLLYCVTPLLEYSQQTLYSNTNVIPSSMSRKRKKSKVILSDSIPTDENEISTKLQNKKVIVLDLDECLVHVSTTKTKTSYPVRLIDERINEVVWVHERPFLKEFLLFCHEHFEQVFVYTAGEGCYAKPILDIITLKHDLPPFSRIFSRNDCNFDSSNSPIKDIQKACPDLSKVFIIDDNPRVIHDWPMNSINIRAFAPNGKSPSNDSELIKLLPYLQKVSDFEGDIRDQLNYFSISETL